MLWTVLIFTPLYVGWALFDRVLLPDTWLLLLAFRLVAAACITVVTFVVYRFGVRRYSFEGMWAVAIVVIAMAATLISGLYPAWKAVKVEPVETITLVWGLPR